MLTLWRSLFDLKFQRARKVLHSVGVPQRTEVKLVV